MSTNRVISAIYNYRENLNKGETRQMLFIPSILNCEQLIFASFIHIFTENIFFQNFVNRWTSNTNHSWGTLLDNFSGDIEKFQLLMNFLQGTIETIEYSNKTPLETIERENAIFANKVLRIINTGESILSKLLIREKFLTPKARFLSFNQLVALLQEQEPRLISNQVALYSQLAVIVERFGTSQLKAEYKEVIKELQIWIKADLPARA